MFHERQAQAAHNRAEWVRNFATAYPILPAARHIARTCFSKCRGTTTITMAEGSDPQLAQQ